MNGSDHHSTPHTPDRPIDPLRRIVELEDRVAVLTRENERLETFLAILRRKIFGRSSEKMSPDQFSLLDPTAPTPADPDATEPDGQENAKAGCRHGGGGRRALPDHLPQVIRELLPASTQC